MAVIILSALFITFLTFLGQFYFSRKKIHRNRRKLGIKGPPTHWLLGNLHCFVERKLKTGHDDAYNWYLELHKKFGKTFGLYLGSLLNIIVSNEQDIKEIFIKNFSNFSDRYVPSFVERSSLSKSLFFSTYSNGWKSCRSAISPIFSSGSMKLMFGVVNQKIDVFLEILEQKSQSGEKFDIQEDFKALTLDVIAKCAFAIDSDCQRDRSDKFYVQAKEFVKNIDYRHSWITMAGMCLQEFGGLWKALFRFSGLHRAEIPLIKGLNELYERRLAGEDSEVVDLLKLMIDRNNRSCSDKKISQQEIVENCFAVLLGGYDTSSTSLSYCTHLLANHPEVQERLYQEIKETEQDLNYDAILGMKYLDAVYKESLRLYPPVFHAINRVCLHDIRIRDHLLIPAGYCVTVTPYTVHRNEENWPNASEFLPERFLGPTVKSNWIPFGVGPRICVGMRFAEMEIKTTMIRMVERFQMSMDPEEPELVTEVEGVVMQPKGPIHVNFLNRE